MQKKLPYICPSCTEALHVQSLACDQCDTQVTGSFPLPALLQLSEEEQKFIFEFICNSGSLKLMAEQMKLSYPSVRNILDDIIEKLNAAVNITSKKK